MCIHVKQIFYCECSFATALPSITHRKHIYQNLVKLRIQWSIVWLKVQCWRLKNRLSGRHLYLRLKRTNWEKMAAVCKKELSLQLTVCYFRFRYKWTKFITVWSRTTWQSFPHSQPTIVHIIIPSWQLTVSMHQIGSLMTNWWLKWQSCSYCMHTTKRKATNSTR